MEEVLLTSELLDVGTIVEEEVRDVVSITEDELRGSDELLRVHEDEVQVGLEDVVLYLRGPVEDIENSA